MKNKNKNYDCDSEHAYSEQIIFTLLEEDENYKERCAIEEHVEYLNNVQS